MKKALYGIITASIFAAAAIGNANAVTIHYRDPSTGLVWTIESPDGQGVGNWRPFQNAAQMCPSLHVLAEKRKLFTGMHASAQQYREARARDVETMHIKCIAGPPARMPIGRPMPPRRPVPYYRQGAQEAPTPARPNVIEAVQDDQI